jgi:DNA-binding NarL/FixJ family response regulator
LRILVVDDHEEVLRSVSDLLASEFDVVGTAADGQGMLLAAEQLIPDIIVTDIEMPRLDGIEATEAVLKVHPAMPVVILTMHVNATLVRRALNAGARGYVHKLHAARDLVPAIRQALEGGTFVSNM